MVHLNVLICGAGIAGNALAYWLSKLGHKVTVIERYTSLRTTGLQIDLRGHGIEVIKRMNLDQQVRAKHVPEQGVEFVTGSGRRVAYFGSNTSGQGVQSFTSEIEIMRGDLCSVFHDNADASIRYLFGQSIDSFIEGDGFVDVTFSDGGKDRFDLLVGADGAGSRTRRMLFGSGSQDPVTFVGVLNAYFTIPMPIIAGEPYKGVQYLANKKRSVFMRRHSDEEVQIYMAFVPEDQDKWVEAQKQGVSAEKALLDETFRGAGWRTDEFLDGLKQTDNFYCERHRVVEAPQWYSSSGNVVLIGDAAHGPSAATGMGTTSSVVGAYILAGEIDKFCGTAGRRDGVREAVEAYDHQFRPFMTQVQRGVAQNSFLKKLPRTNLGVYLVQLVFALCSLFGIDILALLFLREEIKDWSLPDYPEMVQSAHR